MLVPLLFAFQMAAGVQSSALAVRVGDRLRQVPVVSHADAGASVRADLLAEALGAQLTALGAGRFQFALAERTVTMTAGAPWVTSDTSNLPVMVAPFRQDGRLYLPMSMIAETMPRVFSGLLFDADKKELRRFAAVVAQDRPFADTRSLPAAAAAPLRAAPVQPAPPPGAPVAVPRQGRVSASELRHRVVVVDAGHGGPDNGMTGPIGATKKVREKDITLAVAKALQQALEERGVTVVMTRVRDTLIALQDRGRIANTAKGDLFISVHVNAANPRWNQPANARGYETYFLAEAKTEDEKRVEAMENESIRFETSAEMSNSDPLGFIIRDMAQNEHLRESLLLAGLVQQQLKVIHPGPSRGIKQAGFSVLVRAFMPAVLVEVGFGSNGPESAYMTNTEKQRELGAAIADAAVAYLAQYEKKVGPGSP